jgi:prepilin-type N-terminal cleavage/methylation domain-containing protein
MKRHQSIPNQTGFTLVELMITIAILSVLAAIAIPLYTGYIREGNLTTMRSTTNGLRTVLEDFRLDNGSYGAIGSQFTENTSGGVTQISSQYPWDASGDMRAYTYVVSVTGTNSYDVWGTFNANNAIWIRCDNRFSNCCDANTSGATAVTNACP